MRRRLFMLLTMLSLLLCAAAVALWVRSYGSGDLVSRDWREVTTEHRRVVGTSATSWKGVLHLGREVRFHTLAKDRHTGPRFEPRWSWSRLEYAERYADPSLSLSLRQPTFWNRLGFEGFMQEEKYHSGHQRMEWGLAVPYWVLCIGFIILPLYGTIVVFRAQTRRHRAAGGFCIVCGYDLRASSGNCPECGSSRATEPTSTPIGTRSPRRRVLAWAIIATAVALILLPSFVRVVLRVGDDRDRGLDSAAMDEPAPRKEPKTAKDDAEPEARRDGVRRIERGDLIRVTFPDLELPGIDAVRDVRVNERGEIELPLVKPVRVEGSSMEDSAAAIQTAYRDALDIEDLGVKVWIVDEQVLKLPPKGQ